MDAGFGGVTVLKQRLLAESLRSRTDWDETLAAIGRAVVTLFERHCNRLFGFSDQARDTFPAHLVCWTLRRYPVYRLEKLELQGVGGDWRETDITHIRWIDPQAGLIDFATALGSAYELGRVTYSGGYWWDTSEDGSGIPPPGIEQLPPDLREAWLIQSEAVWSARDRLGLRITQSGSPATEQQALVQLQLVPMVRDILQPYIRWQIT